MVLKKQMFLLCCITIVLAGLGCKDPTPVGSNTGNTYDIYPHLGWSFFLGDLNDLIPDLAGSPQGPVQGLLVSFAIYSSSDIAADFAVDGNLGTPSEVMCNGYHLTEMTRIQDPTGGIPLFNGIEYSPPHNWDSAHVTHDSAVNWEIDMPNGETIRDTAMLPPTLEPVIINNDTLPTFPFDTLSSGGGFKISWANPQPGKRIVLQLGWYSPTNNALQLSGDTMIVIADTGGYFLSPEQLQSLGISSHNIMLSINLFRGSYHATKTYNNGKDLLGHLIYAADQEEVILRP